MPPTGPSPQIERLKNRSQFLAVRKGERRKGPFFVLDILDRGASDEAPRIGYTVTKRQGNAVERNRMKRRLREVVRLTAGFDMMPGHDYVIVARRDTLTAPFAKLTKSLVSRIGQQPREKQSQRRAAEPDNRTE